MRKVRNPSKAYYTSTLSLKKKNSKNVGRKANIPQSLVLEAAVSFASRGKNLLIKCSE